jgi:hypothetical protein
MKTIDASGRVRNLTVQLDPRDVASPKDAKAYLEAYFDNMEVQVYWGRAQDFLATLAQKRVERDGV